MKMKRFVFMVLLMNLLILPAVTARETDRNVQFDRGTELFSEGDYSGALEEWLAIYKTGYTSSPLCYNIGNAYFKLNNIPGSILFYERALLLDPTDEDINYNLQIAGPRTVDRLEEIPKLFFVGGSMWFRCCFLQYLGSFSIVSFLLCLVLLSVYFFTSKYKLKVAAFGSFGDAVFCLHLFGKFHKEQESCLPQRIGDYLLTTGKGQKFTG